MDPMQTSTNFMAPIKTLSDFEEAEPSRWYTVAFTVPSVICWDQKKKGKVELHAGDALECIKNSKGSRWYRSNEAMGSLAFTVSDLVQARVVLSKRPKMKVI